MPITNNDNDTFNDASELKDFLEAFKYCTEDENGDPVEVQGACAYTQFLADQNAFSWTQSLLIPATQAAAQILLLNHQKSLYDDENDIKMNLLDTALEEWCACMEELIGDLEEATDDVPKPAMYQPLSPAGEQFDTIANNIEMMCKSRKYASQVGRHNLEMDLVRANTLNPKYYVMNEITWCSIESLLNGEIPVGMTVRELTKSQSQTFSTGRLGRGCGNYRRNMGILDYKMQKDARNEQRLERASQATHVSNLQRQGDIREMMQTPQQRIAVGVQQAQLIQNSLQNAYNACARKSPHLMQQIQYQMQKCQNQMQLLASKASIRNGFVPDYASAVTNQVNDVINGIANGFSQGFGNISSPNTVTSAIPTISKESGNITGGFSPSYMREAGYANIYGG